jgi:O-antigen ligase
MLAMDYCCQIDLLLQHNSSKKWILEKVVFGVFVCQVFVIVCWILSQGRRKRKVNNDRCDEEIVESALLVLFYAGAFAGATIPFVLCLLLLCGSIAKKL